MQKFLQLKKMRVYEEISLMQSVALLSMVVHSHTVNTREDEESVELFLCPICEMGMIGYHQEY